MLYGYKYVNNKPRTYCRCLGIDDNEYIIRADALRRGATKHIEGVGAKVSAYDLTGQEFGYLTVLYKTDKKAANGCNIWHCRCSCGNEIDVTTGNLIRGHTRSCGHKHRSKREDLIYNYLKSHDIDFITEYRFKDCTNSNGNTTLPFDFYLYGYNAVIEYDGEHHYMPVKGWGDVDKFEITKHNDEIKNTYCSVHGLRLLRIPYYKTNEEIIDMIDSFLSPVTITA